MLGFRGAARSVGRWLRVVGWLCCAVVAVGQGVPVPGAPQVGGSEDGVRELGLPTLHVYTNLIQIPVLVLSRMRSPVAPLAEGRFSVSLDSGPAFKPTHVRVEGDDPISLTIFLDPNGASSELLREVSQRMPRLAGGELQARDHVSVYVRSCALMRTGLDVAVDRPIVQSMMDRAMVEARKVQERHGCSPKAGLLDAVMAAMRQTGSLPGRRVVLLVTDGKDHGSVVKWKDLRRYAAGQGMAVFGLSEMESSPNVGIGRLGGAFSASSLSGLGTGAARGGDLGSEDMFGALCELTGGMRMFARVIDTGGELKRLTKMLRERYIVEFPRVAAMTGGAHDILVSVSKMDGFIRPAGVSVPLPDPKILADPMTLPHDASKDPEVGTRRILTPKP